MADNIWEFNFGKNNAKILHGNVLEIVDSLPDESIDCVVTSPPYYAVRDYSSAASVVWGGNNMCNHIWGAALPGHKPGTPEQTKWPSAVGAGAGANASAGRFCQLCGAYYVQLGLENTPDLYLSHLVLIFEKVKRILKKTGTIWINIADSYSGGTLGRNDSGDGGGKFGGPRLEPQQRGPTEGLPSKNLLGIPWRFALKMQECGWYLRQDIIWAKGVSSQRSIEKQIYETAISMNLTETQALQLVQSIDPYVGNSMPESVTDRCSKSHEYIFLMSKCKDYYFDNEAIKEKSAGSKGSFKRNITTKNANISLPNNQMTSHREDREDVQYGGDSRNMRSVWAIPTKPYKGSHFAVFPMQLVTPMILAGSSEKGCCPKCGSPWERVVAKEYSDDANDNREKLDCGNMDDRGVTRTTAGLKDARKHGIAIKKTVGWKPTCDHYGDPVVEKIPCGYCNGTGRGRGYPQANRKEDSPYDAPSETSALHRSGGAYETLIKNGGDGLVETGDPCPHCNGTGIIEQETYDQNLPTIPSVIFDPFSGSGTTAVTAISLKRNALATEVNKEYIELTKERFNKQFKGKLL